jgi:hypothetical protein
MIDNGDDRIILDGNTKIVASDKITVKVGKRGGEPIDLSRDRVLIVDPRTHRPVATIRPLGNPTARRAESPNGLQASSIAASSISPAPSPPKVGDPSDGKLGPLTEPQREQLSRLWVEHPAWSAARVANEFYRGTNRQISSITAEKYRNRAPSDEVAARKNEILKEKEKAG